MMTACTLVARFRAVEGHAREVDALLLGCMEPSRAGVGCLFEDLHREIEGSHAFVILDAWRDKSTFEAHAGSAHVASTAHVASILAKLELLPVEAPVISELECLS